jgi:16S rRNA G966 N2-methylase RsmD
MQQNLFDIDEKTIENIGNPDTYKGIYSFHKYWGKKPIESILYFIQNYTMEGDIIFDPFLGSGFIGKESIKRNRRFIGVDINPFSLEHTKFLLNLPNSKDYKNAFIEIKNNVMKIINESYLLENGKTASHYLWDKEDLIKVWTKSETGRTRIELEPTKFDMDKIVSFNKYEVKNISIRNLFTNSRINTNSSMTIKDLFTKRALRNIDLIINEIKKYPENIQRALYLTLTSSSGQMSQMVFAITNRGKTKNEISEKIEVGSWVIGFWRPDLHFEINVWNCFANRAKRLISALSDDHSCKFKMVNSLNDIFSSTEGYYIENENCLDVIKNIPSNTIKLICTDPPHSDRIPYLELSEMWNSILGKKSEFEKEIVFSNAKERNKTKEKYIKDMTILLEECNRILSVDGILLLYFNARDKESWKFLSIIKESTNLQFVGMFPMEYSANSVVQDNRKGSMKHDYLIIIQNKNSKLFDQFNYNSIPGWVSELPVSEKENYYDI